MVKSGSPKFDEECEKAMYRKALHAMEVALFQKMIFYGQNLSKCCNLLKIKYLEPEQAASILDLYTPQL